MKVSMVNIIEQKTSEQKFWDRVSKTKTCWIWVGGRFIGPFDYGSFRVDGVLVQAHRYSWELHNGPIPDGLCVLHKCDNPPCVRPSHLFLGTHQDNYDDMVMKGRANFQRK